MYNKPQGIMLFSVVIIEKNGGLFNLLTKNNSNYRITMMPIDNGWMSIMSGSV